MDERRRWGFIRNIDRIRAREQLEMIHCLATLFDADGGQAMKQNLAEIAFEGDEYTLVTYLEAVTRRR